MGSSRKPFLGLKTCGAYRKLTFILYFLFIVLPPVIPKAGGMDVYARPGEELEFNTLF